ncbi:MAG TPA: excinuclease ABC subunit UvrA [Chloroflexota bacterium]|nr:excinuclease ABC subunit UvrA [Chloroflexota bacterium]
MRDTISVRGARENNLKNVDVDVPRDALVVFTGLSGSGKSSLAFETIYAEGQRRFLESLSAFSRKFVDQLKKPDVDFVYGLSPVISIEQKTGTKNPRSTVGTLTDVYDYLRVLYATSGTPHCPYCPTGSAGTASSPGAADRVRSREIPVRSPNQLAEHLLSLPAGTRVEISAPIEKIYGEDYPYLFAEVRTKGCRRIRVDDVLMDLGDELDLDEAHTYRLEAIVDTIAVRPDLHKSLVVSIRNALLLGEGFLRLRLIDDGAVPDQSRFFAPVACPVHGVGMGEMEPFYFAFNEPSSACPTCLGLGIYLQVHTDLLVPDKSRSIRGGAFIPEAFRYDKDTWGTRQLHSVALHYGFSLDTPFQDLPPHVLDVVLYGTRGERILIVLPDGATKGEEHAGKLMRFDGIVNQIERRYRHYRRRQVAHDWMEEYLKKVMVERVCPACRGAKLKSQRLLVTLGGQTIVALGDLTLAELKDFLLRLPPLRRQPDAGRHIVKEIVTRLDLMLDIGLDYLSLSRKAATLSGGESQRVRLSVQIGSELMGMLYVLDEPSIGLHPRDNERMIHTLRRLRDIGNTVIVVEHDEATIRAADHIVELGPGAGIHGGALVASGPPDDVLANPASLTARYLGGESLIPTPQRRRTPTGKTLVIRGAAENNLRAIDVSIPLGLFVCVTGVSGSGKSTLVNEVLFKKLYSVFQDSRVLPGAHAGVDGIEHIAGVIEIDQSPIGRMPTSNPATYVGVYDAIRQLFANTPEAKLRGYGASRFSFNVKGGRCEECAGQGLITTALQFMPEVETLCPVCKGARYNPETLEITYKGKTIADVLDLSIEEAVAFFADAPLVAHKLGMLHDLGMGYLKLGQSSTTISGGEAQRVKLALELSKVKRGAHKMYILDEPTTGLHLADIQRLLDSLQRLVDAGNTVVVIEHHLDVVKTADWVIDLGPEGGARGGRLVADGPPERVTQVPESWTGRYLAPLVGSPAVKPSSLLDPGAGRTPATAAAAPRIPYPARASTRSRPRPAASTGRPRARRAVT